MPKRDEEIVRLIRQYSAEQQDPKTIIFCKTIEHARRITKMMGEDVVLVHNGQSNLTNDMALEAFRQGKIRTIVSVQMLNEGIDVPDANVIVFLRNTVSETIFYQQLGRGTRLSPGKNKVKVLDFVANCERIQSVLELKQDLDRFQGHSINDNFTRDAGHADSREKFTLNIATPEFKAKMINIVNLLSEARGHYTKEKLLTDLVKLYEELGRPIGVKDVDNCHWMASWGTYLRYFDSINDVLTQAGLPVSRQNWTDASDEALLGLLRKKSEKMGGSVVKAKDIDDDPDMPCAKTYAERFESVSNARRLAGINVGYKVNKTISEDEALKRLYDKAISLKRRPSCAEINDDPNLPSAAFYMEHFNGLDGAMIKSGANKALDKIGIKEVRNERNDPDVILANFKELVKEKGKKPTRQDIENDDRLPSYQTMRRNLGTIDEVYAMIAAN